jgi:hypothetical protein
MMAFKLFLFAIMIGIFFFVIMAEIPKTPKKPKRKVRW